MTQAQNRIELRDIADKGEAVFSARSFKAGDIISIGVVQKVFSRNEPKTTQIAENKFVYFAGLMSKVNHSCNPNCNIKINELGVYEMIALRDGNRDEEITFDYSMHNYVTDSLIKSCNCGSPNCRGMVVGWKDLPSSTKHECKDLVAAYILELSRQHDAH